MKPYFSDDVSWESAKQTIYSWLGTPHRHKWHKKGRGADCALFIAGVLMEIGVLAELRVPEYPPDWFSNSKTEVIKNAFADHSELAMESGFFLIEVYGNKMRGDILGFSTLPAIGTTNHTGIYIPEDRAFVHCVRGRGVCRMVWGDSWEEKISMQYRLMVV